MPAYKRRERNRHDSSNNGQTRISRSKIDLFLECPRCFYLDRKLGVARTGMPAFSLNSAVDALLKNEFDLLRKKGEAHELMETYKIDAIPFDHPDLPIWRDDVYKYTGACVLHQPTNLEICGIIDDIWINKDEELIVVDYKSTSTNKEISLEDEYKEGYKRQMEIYQWIFRQMGFRVNPTGYFVFANASRNEPKFDGVLQFKTILIPYEGSDSWVEPTILKIKKCLDSDKIPPAAENCEYCGYREAAKEAGA